MIKVLRSAFALLWCGLCFLGVGVPGGVSVARADSLSAALAVAGGGASSDALARALAAALRSSDVNDALRRLRAVLPPEMKEKLARLDPSLLSDSGAGRVLQQVRLYYRQAASYADAPMVKGVLGALVSSPVSVPGGGASAPDLAASGAETVVSADAWRRSDKVSDLGLWLKAFFAEEESGAPEVPAGLGAAAGKVAADVVLSQVGAK